MVSRPALTSITFTLTLPGGKTTNLKLAPIPLLGGQGTADSFYMSPTFLMTLKQDGIETFGRKFPWNKKARAEISKVGVYTISVKGKIVRPIRESSCKNSPTRSDTSSRADAW